MRAACLLFLLLPIGICSSSSQGGQNEIKVSPDQLSPAELTKLYNQKGVQLRMVVRPISGTLGLVDHSGVEMRTPDGRHFLIHKGGNYGTIAGGNTVIVDAKQMSEKWKSISKWERYDGRVGDLVKAGGKDYNLFTENCHIASANIYNKALSEEYKSKPWFLSPVIPEEKKLPKKKVQHTKPKDHKKPSSPDKQRSPSKSNSPNKSNMRGASGTQRKSGSGSSSGSRGNSGSGSGSSSGSRGNSGSGGSSGSSGNIGSRGSSGSRGNSGSRGSSGRRGNSGSGGSSGSRGNIGSRGSSGSRGNSGSGGSSGSRGNSGSRGSSGSRGNSGSRGSSGRRG